MKATLYAVMQPMKKSFRDLSSFAGVVDCGRKGADLFPEGCKLAWRLSIHMETDLQYWSTMLHENTVSPALLLVQPALPLHLALEGMRWLQQRCDAWPVNESAAYIQQVLAALYEKNDDQHDRRTGGLTLEHGMRLILQPLFHECARLDGITGRSTLRDNSVEQKLHANASAEDEGNWEWRSAPEERGHGEILKKLKRALEGRALLEDELSALYRDWNVNNPETSWKKHVQLLYLRGLVNLTNGVKETGRQNSRSFAVHKHADHQFSRVSRNRSMFWIQQNEWIRRFSSKDNGSGTGKRPETQIALQCRRCGSSQEQMRWTLCSVCGDLCPYCETCLTMARSKRCTLMVEGGERLSDHKHQTMSTVHPPKLSSKWNLSPAQMEAADKALEFLYRTSLRRHTGQLHNKAFGFKGSMHIPRFLIWAVTGAGKTEMVYPLIDYELRHGRRVAIATPRKDVVLELAPRVQKAFPQCSIAVLYGGSKQKWETSELTIATTHQLLRFSKAFDCIIIDELDAFPFSNHPMLAYAAEKACKSTGRYLFLSATPPMYLRKQIRRRLAEHVKVPVRYHRHPLPVPKWVRSPSLQKICAAKINDARSINDALFNHTQPKNHSQLKNHTQPKNLKNHAPSFKLFSSVAPRWVQLIRASLHRGAQIFLFVARIRLVEPFVATLRREFPEVRVEGTHSQDEGRSVKVAAFRDGAIRMLVTTTILERGVTVPKTDVFIMDADQSLFDETALVQMAGRAGRSKDDPDGNVYFLAECRTREMSRAIRQVKLMNRIAYRKGYLDKSFRRKC